MARLKDRLMDARLARSLAILIIVTLALYALTAVAFHHLFVTQIGEVRNLAYSLEGQYIGSWQTFRPTPIQPGVKVAAAAMLRRSVDTHSHASAHHAKRTVLGGQVLSEMQKETG